MKLKNILFLTCVIFTITSNTIVASKKMSTKKRIIIEELIELTSDLKDEDFYYETLEVKSDYNKIIKKINQSNLKTISKSIENLKKAASQKIRKNKDTTKITFTKKNIMELELAKQKIESLKNITTESDDEYDSDYDSNDESGSDDDEYESKSDDEYDFVSDDDDDESQPDDDEHKTKALPTQKKVESDDYESDDDESDEYSDTETLKLAEEIKTESDDESDDEYSDKETLKLTEKNETESFSQLPTQKEREGQGESFESDDEFEKIRKKNREEFEKENKKFYDKFQ